MKGLKYRQLRHGFCLKNSLSEAKGRQRSITGNYSGITAINTDSVGGHVREGITNLATRGIWGI